MGAEAILHAAWNIDKMDGVPIIVGRCVRIMGEPLTSLGAWMEIDKRLQLYSGGWCVTEPLRKGTPAVAAECHHDDLSPCAISAERRGGISNK